MNYRFRQNLLGKQVLQVEHYEQVVSCNRFTNDEHAYMAPVWRDATRWEAEEYVRSSSRAVAFFREHAPKG